MNLSKPTILTLLMNLLLAIAVAMAVCNGVQLHRTENGIEATQRALDAYRASNAADATAYIGCVRFIATLSQLAAIDACVAESAQ